MKTRLLIPVLLGVALARPALAERPVGIEVHGGWSWYTMSDVNDSLASLNGSIGTSLDAIHGGPTWGAALRIWARSDILVRIGFERLSAISDDSQARFSVSAYDVSLGATWFPHTASRVRIGYGVNVAPYYAIGRLSSSGNGLNAGGTGYGVCLTAEALTPMGQSWSVTGTLGLRVARVSSLDFEGSRSELDAQYLGPFVRLSLAADSRGPPVRPK